MDKLIRLRDNTICCLLFVVYYFICCLLFVVYYLLFTICCFYLLFIICCLFLCCLLLFYCLLFIFYYLLFICCCLLIIVYWLLFIICCLLLFIDCCELCIFSPPDSTFGLYYKTYKEGIINIFVFSSTWLTVIMALGRYVAVCRPLHARGFINLRGTRLSISSVFIGSLLINIPRFLHYYVMRTPCTDLAEEMNLTAPAFDMPNCSCYLYQLDTGWLYQNESFVFYYDLAWSIVAIFHPLLVLTVCNACLIRALRHSRKMQKLYRANKPKDSGHRITPTPHCPHRHVHRVRRTLWNPHLLSQVRP